MKKLLSSIFATSLLLSSFACNKTSNNTELQSEINNVQAQAVRNSKVKIGTFNIYWLYEMGEDTIFLEPGRNQQDFNMIAEVIMDTKADLLVLQETSSNRAVMELVQTLNKFDKGANWSYKTKSGEMLRGHNRNSSKSDNQEVAVIYKQSVLDVTGKKHLFETMADSGNDRMREPLLVHVKVKGDESATDFDLIGVHMKALSGDWKKIKQTELSKMTKWVQNRKNLSETADHKSWTKGTYDPDLLIIGDYNATYLNRGDDRARQAGVFVNKMKTDLKFTIPVYPKDSNGIETSTYIHPVYKNVIDILMMSPGFGRLTNNKTAVYKYDEKKDLSKLRAAKKKLRNGKWVDIEKFNRVSDHRPVTIDINVTDLK